jgi:hypothetical protein
MTSCAHRRLRSAMLVFRLEARPRRAMRQAAKDENSPVQLA